MSKVEVRPSSREGLGIFAASNYGSGQVIAEITGNVMHWRTVIAVGGIILDNTFRFSSEYYLSPDGIGNYLNHSCDPNAGIHKERGKLWLKSVRKIRKGEEIAFDYSTITGADDIWTMKCRCGAASCRKTVRNFGALSPDLQKRYVSLGAVPAYIIGTL
jgi:uncharacterized protein